MFKEINGKNCIFHFVSLKAKNNLSLHLILLHTHEETRILELHIFSRQISGNRRTSRLKKLFEQVMIKILHRLVQKFSNFFCNDSALLCTHSGKEYGLKISCQNHRVFKSLFYFVVFFISRL